MKGLFEADDHEEKSSYTEEPDARLSRRLWREQHRVWTSNESSWLSQLVLVKARVDSERVTPVKRWLGLVL